MYEIILAPEAAQDLKRLSAYDRTIVREALETHLRHEPKKTSKSRMKKLRGLAQPQYRLRAGDFRAFYDVVGDEVHVLAIIAKADADRWLEQAGKPDEEKDN